MRVAQCIAPVAQRQRQHGHGVVFKVHVAHHAIGAAHQVAGEGLAQARALVVHQLNGTQPLHPQAQHGLGASGHGCFNLGAQRGRLLGRAAQVAHQKAVVLCRQHRGHAQAACGQVAQALHLGGNGDVAAQVGHRLQHGQAKQQRQRAQHAVARHAVRRVGSFHPHLLIAQAVARGIELLGLQLAGEEGGVVHRRGGPLQGLCNHGQIH